MGKLSLAAKVTHVPSMYLSELPGPHHGCRAAAIEGHRVIAQRCRELGVDTIVVAAAHVVVMPRWRFRVHRWEATANAVYTQSGWFSQERRIAPISRIQTVDTERGPLEQLFGLSNVTVTTASAAGPLKIHGLDRDRAQELVDELARAIESTAGDAT